jgi:hypothetical protein
MTQLTSLAWKEWHEVRWFLAAALGLFVGMPIVGGVQAMTIGRQGHFFFDAGPWVITLGGVIAVIVAVGIVCHDLGGRGEDFLRSRPLNLMRWVLVKYVAGLSSVLLACVLPLALELKLNNFGWSHTEIAITWYPFFWIAIYSLGFLCAALFRRTAHAAMLALAAMLLMYFLPVVLPFLHDLSIDAVMERSETLAYGVKNPALPWGARFEPRQFIFVGSMLAIGAVTLAASLLAIIRDWRIELGNKTLYWSAGSALLILFASASLPLATNLPTLQQIELAKCESVREIRMAGSAGFVLTSDQFWWSLSRVRQVRMVNGSMQLGPAVSLVQRGTVPDREAIVGAPSDSQVLYVCNSQWDHPEKMSHLMLNIVRLDGSTPPSQGTLQQILLWKQKPDPRHTLLFAWENRLYAMGEKLAILDISAPTDPRLISVEELHYGSHSPQDRSEREFWWSLPLIPGLPPRQRLATFLLRSSALSMSGDLLCASEGSGLRVFHLEHLDEQVAHFVEVGQRGPNMLEEAFGHGVNDVNAEGDFAYLTETLGSRRFDFRTPHLSVYDIREPRRPQPVGHFAATVEGSLAVCPLPDGRAIAGAANKLYLLGKPPARD